MPPLSCEQAMRQVSAYLDRALSGGSLENLEAHLDACLVCCDKLAFSRQLDGFFKRRLLDHPVPQGLEDRVRQALGTRSSQEREHREASLYLDIHHHVEGLTAVGAARAHQRDLEVQGKYGVRYLRYWYDERMGKVFCLIEAPSREAAAAVHREAHGFVADEIIEVKEGL